MYRGEIWLINLEPTIGAEITKTRPALIINNNKLGILPLKIVIPITDWKDKFKYAPWLIKIFPDKINNLNKHSALDCFQVRSVSEDRFIKKIGIINEDIIAQIENSLLIVFGITIP